MPKNQKINAAHQHSLTEQMIPPASSRSSLDDDDDDGCHEACGTTIQLAAGDLLVGMMVVTATEICLRECRRDRVGIVVLQAE